MHAASMVERILATGSTSSTYKFGLLRAIVDHVIESPAQEPKNGLHFLPVVDLARRVLAHYWRPTLEGIRQGSGPTDKIPDAILKLKMLGNCASVSGVDLTDSLNGFRLSLEITQVEALSKSLIRSLRAIRRTLLEMPIQHLPHVPRQRNARSPSSPTDKSALERSERLPLYSVVTVHERDGHLHSWFDSSKEHIDRALGLGRLLVGPGWAHLVEQERAFLVFSARTYEEMASLRFWLRDAIAVRWIRECKKYNTGEALGRLTVQFLDDPIPPRSEKIKLESGASTPRGQPWKERQVRLRAGGVHVVCRGLQALSGKVP